MEEEEKPKMEESMSASDGKCEYSSKETMGESSYESDMELEDPNKD